MSFLEYICLVCVSVYVGEVGYVSSIQISTIARTNVNVFNSSFDYIRGDMGDRTMIVAVDWKWW